MNKSIFISKSAEEVIELAEFCKKKKIDLITRSLIRFEPVSFQINKPFNVIFFSSIRAAHFFLENQQVDKHIKIACIGKATAEKLLKYGLSCDFIGENSGKPKEVARSFKTWLGDNTVLIPRSEISKQTITSIIPSKQLEDVIVYKTKQDCKIIQSCDTYVFTSPSNFESFLTCNSAINGEIIAWGDTTKSCIQSHGFHVNITLENSDLKELMLHIH